MKPLKVIRTKFLIRRVEICIYDKDGEYLIRVYTKRLVDFKKREIFKNEVMYSLETFIGVASVFSLFLKYENQYQNNSTIRQRYFSQNHQKLLP